MYSFLLPFAVFCVYELFDSFKVSKSFHILFNPSVIKRAKKYVYKFLYVCSGISCIDLEVFVIFSHWISKIKKYILLKSIIFGDFLPILQHSYYKFANNDLCDRMRRPALGFLILLNSNTGDSVLNLAEDKHTIFLLLVALLQSR